jgi:multicomponent Na+:H+ antiporter subunit E
MRHIVSLYLLLLAAWTLWSGLSWPWGEHFEPLVAVMGVLSTALVVFIAWGMDLVDSEGAPLQLTTFRTLAYIPWLAWEIVKANIDVARRILDPRLPISPNMIEVVASQSSEIGRVVYANSITLTPGTVSVTVEAATIAVHALTREAAAGVETGDMDRRVSRVEGSD